MPLAIFIDDQLHRLFGDQLDFFMQRLGQLIRRPGIDDDDAVARDDKGQIVVVAAIFIGRRSCRADRGPHIRDELDRLRIKNRARILILDLLAGDRAA